MEIELVCHRAIDVEEGGHSTTRIIWNVDLEKVTKNQPGHWSNQEVLDMVDENRNLMNTIRQRQKNWLGHVLRSECLMHTSEKPNGRDKNSWETRCYDDGLDKEQRHGIWTYKEKSLWQEKTGVIVGLDLPEKAEHSMRERESWTCLA